MKKLRYIVYDQDFKIVKTFDFFGKDIMGLLRSNDKLEWLNTSMPWRKNDLKKINEVNKTNF